MFNKFTRKLDPKKLGEDSAEFAWSYEDKVDPRVSFTDAGANEDVNPLFTHSSWSSAFTASRQLL